MVISLVDIKFDSHLAFPSCPLVPYLV